MADVITVSCPSCGAKLEPTQDIDSCSCVYCGNRYFVTRTGSVAHIEAVISSVGEILGEIGSTASKSATRQVGDKLATLMIERDSIQARITLLNEEKQTSIMRSRARRILVVSGPTTVLLLFGTVGLFWAASASLRSESVACPALIAGLLLVSAAVVSGLALSTLVSTVKPRPMADLEEKIKSGAQDLQKTVAAIERVQGQLSGRPRAAGSPR